MSVIRAETKAISWGRPSSPSGLRRLRSERVADGLHEWKPNPSVSFLNGRLHFSRSAILCGIYYNAFRKSIPIWKPTENPPEAASTIHTESPNSLEDRAYYLCGTNSSFLGGRKPQWKSRRWESRTQVKSARRNATRCARSTAKNGASITYVKETGK